MESRARVIPDNPAAVAAEAQRVRSSWGQARPVRRRRVMLPAVLFAATCASTFWAAAADFYPALLFELDLDARDAWRVIYETILANWSQGATYMAAVMAILAAHEMGHFLMARRHRIPASLPFFIPMPIFPFGTMGAVIGMEGSRADRRQMFDQGLAGPLAGLAVALPVTWLGIRQYVAGPAASYDYQFHNPLIFQWLFQVCRPDVIDSSVIHLSRINPCLMAGYVGLLVTGLNMIPIGQLDGGHVAYALLGRRAHTLARTLLIGTILFVVFGERYNWVLMVVLVTLIGTDHPPTADDRAPLGWPRRALGYASLAIPALCFHPSVITEVAG